MLTAKFALRKNVYPRSFCLASYDYTYAMLVSLKLSTLDLPGWDLRLVRQELDFDRYLVTQIQELRKFAAARADTSRNGDGDGDASRSTAHGHPEFQDPYIRLIKRLAQLRARIASELATSLPPDVQLVRDAGAQDPDAAAAAAADATAQNTTQDMTAIFGAEVSVDVPQSLGDLFWQDLYKANEWENNFSALLGWGPDDVTDPAYAGWAGAGPVWSY